MHKTIKATAVSSILCMLFFWGPLHSLANSDTQNITGPTKHLLEVEIKGSNSNTVGIISSITALLAIILGPIVTVSIARKQLYYPTRQNLLDNFNNTISQFLNTLDTYRTRKDANMLSEEQQHELLSNLNLYYHKLGQIINASIPIQKELIETARSYNDVLQTGKYSKELLETTREKIIYLSRDISIYHSKI